MFEFLNNLLPKGLIHVVQNTKIEINQHNHYEAPKRKRKKALAKSPKTPKGRPKAKDLPSRARLSG